MTDKYRSLDQDTGKRKHNLDGLAFPMYLDNRGRFGRSHVDVKKGDYEKIKENVRQIIMTAPGQRAMRPEFGGNFFEVFALNTMSRRALRARDIKRAIERWEPRIDTVKVQPLEPTPEEEQKGIARTRLEILINKDKLVANVESQDGSVDIKYN